MVMDVTYLWCHRNKILPLFELFQHQRGSLLFHGLWLELKVLVGRCEVVEPLNVDILIMAFLPEDLLIGTYR